MQREAQYNMEVNMLKDAIYVIDDDLKDAEMYAEAAKTAKRKGADECARIYANKAKHRAGEDFEQSKTVLNNVIQKMANSGMKSAPDSIEAMLWAEAMNKYTSWAERIKLKIKNMGY